MIRLLRLLAVLFALAGCVATSTLSARPAASEITAFAISGRISVRQGETRHHLKIDWRHDPGRDDMLLATPLGQGIAQIVRDEAGARLRLADQREVLATDTATLAEQVFGFPLSLEACARVLLGNGQHAPGWSWRVVERESDRADALPTLVEFERDDIAVHLKIDAWSDVQ